MVTGAARAGNDVVSGRKGVPPERGDPGSGVTSGGRHAPADTDSGDGGEYPAEDT